MVSSSSSQAVKYVEVDDKVDEMEGLGRSSMDDTEDAEDELEDEVKDGTVNDDWNKGVAGGTISSSRRWLWMWKGTLGVARDSELTEDLSGDRRAKSVAARAWDRPRRATRNDFGEAISRLGPWNGFVLGWSSKVASGVWGRLQNSCRMGVAGGKKSSMERDALGGRMGAT